MEIQNDVKKFASTLNAKFHAYGFWIIIVFCVGIICGIGYLENKLESKMGDSIQLGGMIYKGEVYDIKKRVIQ